MIIEAKEGVPAVSVQASGAPGLIFVLDGDLTLWLDRGGEPKYYLGSLGAGDILEICKGEKGRPDDPGNRGAPVATIRMPCFEEVGGGGDASKGSVRQTN